MFLRVGVAMLAAALLITATACSTETGKKAEPQTPATTKPTPTKPAQAPPIVRLRHDWDKSLSQSAHRGTGRWLRLHDGHAELLVPVKMPQVETLGLCHILATLAFDGDYGVDSVSVSSRSGKPLAYANPVDWHCSAV